MKARFDADALRVLAGERAFERGEAYHREGQVELISVSAARVVAQVSGTEDYRTIVTGQGGKIGGECSCPAFADRGFCKHMLAVALAANAAGGEAEGADAAARIRQHLGKLHVEVLTAMIMEQAERDPGFWRRLELAATALEGDDKALEASLKKAINSAARTGGFVEYRAARGWAAGVAEALEVVGALVPGGRGALALRLADHALKKIEAAMQHVDDSDGHCGGLLRQAAEIHLAACEAVRPDPVKLAGELFQREVEEDYDTFHGAVSTYSDVLGASGLAAFKALAQAAWEKLPPRRHSKGGIAEYSP